MKLTVIKALVAVGIFAAGAMAHDPSLHKGKATTGEIVSVGQDRFEMKSGNDTTVVSFSSKTKFEHGNQKVDKSHLSKGAQVSVVGTKLPTGELVAREVMLGAATAGADHSTMKHNEKEKAEHKH